MLAANIPKLLEESGIWQGGASKSWFGASDHCRVARREWKSRFWGKADAAKNRFFRLFRYNYSPPSFVGSWKNFEIIFSAFSLASVVNLLSPQKREWPPGLIMRDWLYAALYEAPAFHRCFLGFLHVLSDVWAANPRRRGRLADADRHRKCGRSRLVASVRRSGSQWVDRCGSRK